jgi:hypothetical protein
VEQVRETEVVSLDDPSVEELKNNPNENLPEFERLGSEIEGQGIEIRTIKKKLIHSEPYIPGSIASTGEDSPNVWGGIIGMLIGVVMVVGIERLRE